ncbi:hypothetical protein ABIA33_004717 [Streptacidiphilus sp. MAP12-16]|uniref:hypothetical protein n=1 Tax=Streptacidiphilus sp. MAP12-16 TaxID=3156300 RepID=UPI00351579D7
MVNDMPTDLLITGPSPVTMGDRGAPARPGRVLLFSTDDGQVVELSRRPGAWASMKYEFRYEVDTSDHVVGWSDVLPSGTGGFPFQSSLEARWKVTNAAEVVNRGIKSVADGQVAVCVAMRDLLWQHSGLYGIERLEDLASFVRMSVCPYQHPLPIGITVTTLTVRLYLDEHASNHLRAVKQKEFDNQLAQAGHVVAMTEHKLEAELQAEREKALLAAARGEGGLVLRLIAQDPSKLQEIMLQLGNRHDVAVEQKAQMLRDLIDAKLIQPAEAQTMWQEMHRPVPLFGTGPQELSAPTGPAPAQLQPGTGMPPGSSTQGPGSMAGQAPVPGQPQQAQVVAGIVMGPATNGTPPKPRYHPDDKQAVSNPAQPPQLHVQPETTLTKGDVPPPPPFPPAPAPQPPAAEPDAADPSGSANVTGTTPVGRRRDNGSGGNGG